MWKRDFDLSGGNDDRAMEEIVEGGSGEKQKAFYTRIKLSKNRFDQ